MKNKQVLNKEALILITRDIIEVNNLADKDGDEYRVLVFADYDEEIDASKRQQIIQSENPREMFYDALQIGIDQLYSDEIDYMIEQIKSKFDEQIYGDFDLYYDDVRSFLYESITLQMNEKHYLKHQVDVTFIVDVGDGEKDFTLNNFGSNSSFPEIFANEIDVIDSKSGILWLIEQQGYSKMQLFNAIKFNRYCGSTLLQSVANELDEVNTSINALTIVKTMTLGDAIDIIETIKENENIEFEKETRLGSFDFIGGSGSDMNIQLEEKLIIPTKFIKVQDSGISVSDVYGGFLV